MKTFNEWLQEREVFENQEIDGLENLELLDESLRASHGFVSVKNAPEKDEAMKTYKVLVAIFQKQKGIKKLPTGIVDNVDRLLKLLIPNINYLSPKQKTNIDIIATRFGLGSFADIVKKQLSIPIGNSKEKFAKYLPPHDLPPHDHDDVWKNAK